MQVGRLIECSPTQDAISRLLDVTRAENTYGRSLSWSIPRTTSRYSMLKRQEHSLLSSAKQAKAGTKTTLPTWENSYLLSQEVSLTAICDSLTLRVARIRMFYVQVYVITTDTCSSVSPEAFRSISTTSTNTQTYIY